MDYFADGLRDGPIALAQHTREQLLLHCETQRLRNLKQEACQFFLLTHCALDPQEVVSDLLLQWFRQLSVLHGSVDDINLSLVLS